MITNFYVERTPEQGEKILNVGQIGFLYKINKKLGFDSSIGTGFTGEGTSPRIVWTSGISYVF